MTTKYEQCARLIKTIHEKHNVNFISLFDENTDLFVDIFINRKTSVETITNIDTDTDAGIKYDVLGIYYYWILNDFEQAINAWSKAIDLSNTNAMNHMGMCYKHEYWKCKNHISKIIVRRVKQAFQWANHMFGGQYQCVIPRDLFNESVRYYLMAIEGGNVYALYNLGWVYYWERKYNLAMDYFVRAISSGVTDGLVGAGWCCLRKNDYEQAIKYFLSGYERDHEQCFQFILETGTKYLLPNDVLYTICKTVCLGNNSTHIDTIMTENKIMFGSVLNKWKILNKLCEEMGDGIEKKMSELETNPDVQLLKKKILNAKRNQVFDTCLLCLDENVLNVEMSCGHKICVECYDPSAKCVYSWCRSVPQHKH